MNMYDVNNIQTATSRPYKVLPGLGYSNIPNDISPVRDSIIMRVWALQ